MCYMYRLLFLLPDDSTVSNEFKKGHTIAVLKAFLEDEYDLKQHETQLCLDGTVLLDHFSLTDQHPSDLLSATQMAIRDCGMYGEGTQVGWEDACARHSRNTGMLRIPGGGVRTMTTPASAASIAALLPQLVVGQRMTLPSPS
ncbi:hypothetical protein PHPALM_9271 [Phytophthora palmivora]|uniref:Uncharacterized protein n=1 Tax=Phytophthora palmivora TaxID=4796 RepID=A0A2P4Y7Q9_9STRA|nr:hypothetical protein PHPALM_9271 [Phytophthora palmivora]